VFGWYYRSSQGKDYVFLALCFLVEPPNRQDAKRPDPGPDTNPAPKPAEEDPKAVAALEKLGVKLKRDEKQPGKPVIEVDFGAITTTDEMLAHLKGLPNLEKLDLMFKDQVTDAGLAHLKGLTALRSLILKGPKITDKGLGYLKD